MLKFKVSIYRQRVSGSKHAQVIKQKWVIGHETICSHRSPAGKRSALIPRAEKAVATPAQTSTLNRLNDGHDINKIGSRFRTLNTQEHKMLALHIIPDS